MNRVGTKFPEVKSLINQIGSYRTDMVSLCGNYLVYKITSRPFGYTLAGDFDWDFCYYNKLGGIGIVYCNRKTNKPIFALKVKEFKK